MNLKDFSSTILKAMVDRKKKGKMKIQKFEYLENEKSFLDEIKSIFRNYLRAIIWWKKEKWRTQALTTPIHQLGTGE